MSSGFSNLLSSNSIGAGLVVGTKYFTSLPAPTRTVGRGGQQNRPVVVLNTHAGRLGPKGGGHAKPDLNLQEPYVGYCTFREGCTGNH